MCFPVYKRSTDEVSHPLELSAHIGFFSWKKSEGDSHIFKIDIYREQEVGSEKGQQSVHSPVH